MQGWYCVSELAISPFFFITWHDQIWYFQYFLLPESFKQILSEREELLACFALVVVWFEGNPKNNEDFFDMKFTYAYFNFMKPRNGAPVQQWFIVI